MTPFLNRTKGYTMKNIMLVLMATLMFTACSQPKDIYFNGSEGSNSGIKYERETKRFSVNH